MATKWHSICQWCGERGKIINYDPYNARNILFPMLRRKVPPPVVNGNCPNHPSGNPEAKHGAQWTKMVNKSIWDDFI